MCGHRSMDDNGRNAGGAPASREFKTGNSSVFRGGGMLGIWNYMLQDDINVFRSNTSIVSQTRLPDSLLRDHIVNVVEEPVTH